MHTELTKDDIQDSLIDSGILLNAEELNKADKSDLCYLIYMHAENLSRVLGELAADYAKIAANYLEDCLKTPNEKYRIETVVRRKVNIQKLIELRPDLYKSFRTLSPEFVARCFSPYELIELFKSAGITEEEIQRSPKNVRVAVNAVEKRLSAEEVREIILPFQHSYSIFEVEE